MPDHVTDTRDFQLVKTCPYPAEVKAQFFRNLYEELSQEQRCKLPYIMDDCPGWVFCELFIDSDKAERERLFERVDQAQTNRPSIGTIQGYADAIKSKRDIDQLRQGLAAAVLLNGNDDYRDIFMSLCELWLTAVRVGIDPYPYFQTAARTARSDEPYLTSTRHVLADFHTFAIFREQVAPYLPK